MAHSRNMSSDASGRARKICKKITLNRFPIRRLYRVFLVLFFFNKKKHKNKITCKRERAKIAVCTCQTNVQNVF